VQILLVEDSSVVSAAMLEACGADVAGPVATMVEADRLISENLPDAALSTLISEAVSRPMA
jgi:hypothetical protein